MQMVDDDEATEQLIGYLKFGTGNLRYTSNGSGGMPERKLVAAVLLRAVQDFTRLHGRSKGWTKYTTEDENNNAGWWIFEERSVRPFGFAWCCDILDLELDRCRERIWRLGGLISKSGYVHRSTAYRPDLLEFIEARTETVVEVVM